MVEVVDLHSIMVEVEVLPSSLEVVGVEHHSSWGEVVEVPHSSWGEAVVGDTAHLLSGLMHPMDHNIKEKISKVVTHSHITL